MVVVTWPSILFEIECVSVGVGGKNKTKKKRQTSNNNSIGWLDRQHALIFSRWFQRSGRAPFYFAYPLFSWLLTVYGQLYSPTLIRLHSVLSIEQKKWPQRIAPESNTLFPFLLFFFISNTPTADECMNCKSLAASHLFWFRWLKSFASVERMIGLMMMINWSRSRTDTLLFTLSIRDNQNITRDTTHNHQSI